MFVGLSYHPSGLGDSERAHHDNREIMGQNLENAEYTHHLPDYPLYSHSNVYNG